MELLKKKIAEAILTTLVVTNKVSIPIAVDKIITVIENNKIKTNENND